MHALAPVRRYRSHPTCAPGAAVSFVAKRIAINHAPFLRTFYIDNNLGAFLMAGYTQRALSIGVCHAAGTTDLFMKLERRHRACPSHAYDTVWPMPDPVREAIKAQNLRMPGVRARHRRSPIGWSFAGYAGRATGATWCQYTGLNFLENHEHATPSIH